MKLVQANPSVSLALSFPRARSLSLSGFAFLVSLIDPFFLSCSSLCCSFVLQIVDKMLTLFLWKKKKPAQSKHSSSSSSHHK
jgi:hypothetical protein